MTAELAIHGGTPVRSAAFPAWPVFDETEEEALLSVLRSRRWSSISGDVVSSLETEFASLHEAEHGVAVANGTLALVAALRAVGIGPGDEVIVPPYTFIASASSVVLSGAVPVFADVQPDTLLIDPEAVSAAITPRTKAIMAVHLAGCPCDMDALTEIAEAHGIVVIEDAAQAVGAEWRSRRVGAIGAIGTFSFQSYKNITAGEGGMILTNDSALADATWSIANVGRRRSGGWYEHSIIGWNLRLTEFQAALVRAQLGRLPEQSRVRAANAAVLSDLLTETPGVNPLKVDQRVTAHSWYTYNVRLDASLPKDAFVEALAAEGIPCQGGWDSLNRNPALRDAVRDLVEDASADFPACPVSEAAVADSFWLPQSVLLGTPADMEDVAHAMAKVAAAIAP